MGMKTIHTTRHADGRETAQRPLQTEAIAQGIRRRFPLPHGLPNRIVQIDDRLHDTRTLRRLFADSKRFAVTTGPEYRIAGRDRVSLAKSA